jgi:hypothetical protein
MRPLTLNATKPACPWCGSSASRVTFSRGDGRVAGYRRRRRCIECGKRWPTVEVLDVERFAREVRRQGIPLRDVGLDDTPADQARVRAYAARWATAVPAHLIASIVASVGDQITPQEAYDLLDTEQQRLQGSTHVLDP